MNAQPSTLHSQRSTLHSQPAIELHIERLVLDGLPITSNQSAALQAAVETELTRLLTQQGLSGLSGRAVSHLSVGSIQLTPGSKPEYLGHQIAQAVFGGLAPAPALRASSTGGATV